MLHRVIFQPENALAILLLLPIYCCCCCAMYILLFRVCVSAFLSLLSPRLCELCECTKFNAINFVGGWQRRKKSSKRSGVNGKKICHSFGGEWCPAPSREAPQSVLRTVVNFWSLFYVLFVWFLRAENSFFKRLLLLLIS